MNSTQFGKKRTSFNVLDSKLVNINENSNRNFGNESMDQWNNSYMSTDQPDSKKNQTHRGSFLPPFKSKGSAHPITPTPNAAQNTGFMNITASYTCDSTDT